MGLLKTVLSAILAIVLTPYLFPTTPQRLINTLLIYQPSDLNNTYELLPTILSLTFPLECFFRLQEKFMMYLLVIDIMGKAKHMRVLPEEMRVEHSSRETSHPKDSQANNNLTIYGDLKLLYWLDDLTGISTKDCNALFSWLKFFRSHKRYTHVGYLQGRFYDSQGNPTLHRQQLESCHQDYLAEQPLRDEVKEQRQCTTMFLLNHHHIGCSTRDFVPRRIQYMAVKGNCTSSKFLRVNNIVWVGVEEKCVCVPSEETSNRLDMLPFPNCDPQASLCRVSAA